MQLYDETTRFPDDCNLLGCLEYKVSELARKHKCEQSCQLEIKWTDNPNEDQVARRYHIFVRGLPIFALEDEEEFFVMMPAVFTHQRIQITLPNDPDSVPFMEIMISIPIKDASSGGWPPKRFSAEAAASMYTHLCVVKRSSLTRSSSTAHDLLDMTQQMEETPLVMASLLSPPATTTTTTTVAPPRSALVSFFDMCTRGKSATAAAAAANTANNMVPAPPSIVAPSQDVAVGNGTHTFPLMDKSPRHGFPFGLPVCLTREHVPESEMTSLDIDVWHVLRSIVAMFIGVRTPADLRVQCGGAGRTYYALYAYGYHHIGVHHQRHVVLTFPSRVSSVFVDVRSRCLVVLWTRSPLLPDCYWSLHASSHDFNSMRNHPIHAKLLPTRPPSLPSQLDTAPPPPVHVISKDKFMHPKAATAAVVVTNGTPQPVVAAVESEPDESSGFWGVLSEAILGKTSAPPAPIAPSRADPLLMAFPLEPTGPSAAVTTPKTSTGRKKYSSETSSESDRSRSRERRKKRDKKKKDKTKKPRKRSLTPKRLRDPTSTTNTAPLQSLPSPQMIEAKKSSKTKTKRSSDRSRSPFLSKKNKVREIIGIPVKSRTNEIDPYPSDSEPLRSPPLPSSSTMTLHPTTTTSKSAPPPPASSIHTKTHNPSSALLWKSPPPSSLLPTIKSFNKR